VELGTRTHYRVSSPVNSLIASGQRLTSASCVPGTSRGCLFAEPVGGVGTPTERSDAFLAERVARNPLLPGPHPEGESPWTSNVLAGTAV
jgi:hypothetical protein